MKLHPRKKFFLTASLSLVIVGILGFTLWRLLSQIKKVDATLKEIANKMVQLEAERKIAREAKVLLKDRAGDLAKINKFFVDRDEPVEFIENMEEAAKKTNNKIVIDFDEGRSKDKNLFFRLTVEGSEVHTRKYLKLLGLMPYKIKIEDLVFQKIDAGKAPDSSRLIVLMQVETL